MNSCFFNQNIERSILSSIFFDPKIFYSINLKINEDDFYLPAHKNIYKTMIELNNNNLPIDDEFVRKILLKNNQFDENILIEVLSTNPITNIQKYCDILKEYTQKRELNKIILTAKKELEDNSSAIELQNFIIYKIEQIKEKNKTSLVNIFNLNMIEEEESDFILKNWLPFPKKTVSLITAPGGTGKSWLSLQIALRFLNEAKKAKAFLWLSEDPLGLSKNRAQKISTSILNIHSTNIFDRLFITNEQTIQFLAEKGRGVEINSLFYEFKYLMREYELIILDPLIAFFGGDENNNSQARKFMQLFTEWASKENKIIIFIHHSTKNTTTSRGASAFIDAVRLVYEIDKKKVDEDKEYLFSHLRTFKITKDNYGVGHLIGKINFDREIFPKNKQTNIQVEIITKMVDDEF
jgi:replicative DNA helicase